MKYLHTMVRVTDLEASLDFYCDKLGLRETRRREDNNGRYTLVFLCALGDENAQIELTHNWEQDDPYVLGDGFGHLAIGVNDIDGTCERLTAGGVPIPRPAGPMKHGGSSIAFIEDPDGYRIELIERG